MGQIFVAIDHPLSLHFRIIIICTIITIDPSLIAKSSKYPETHNNKPEVPEFEATELYLFASLKKHY